MWLLKHNCSWLARAATYSTNEAHSLAYLQDLIPTLAGVYCLYIKIMPLKVGIKSCRCARECVSFVQDVAAQASQLQLCLSSHM